MSSAKPTLGSMVKALRARQGWTLKEMSDRTGIPFSTLSKVEHDRLTLTYDKLQQLSERLRIPMSDLFAQPESESVPVTARRSIGRLDTAVQVTTKNYDYFYFCPELRRKRMLPILTRIRAKSIDEFGDLVRHAGEEFIYVLEGHVAVHTEFYDPVTIGPGEAMYIDSNMGHAYVIGDDGDEATILSGCSSGEADQMEALLSSHGAVAPAQASELRAPTAVPTRRRRRAGTPAAARKAGLSSSG